MIKFYESNVLIKTEASTYEKADYNIYYRIFGPKNDSDIKADIILIPSICVNVTHYNEVAYYLAENNFRVILFDLPGFGLSSGILRCGLDNYDSFDYDVFKTGTIYIYPQILNGVLDDVFKKTNINKPKISLGDSFGGFIGLYTQNVNRSQMDYVENPSSLSNNFIGNIITNPILKIKNPNYNRFERFLITVGLKSNKLYVYDVENLQNHNLISDIDRRFEFFRSTLKSSDYIDYKLFLKVFSNKEVFNGSFLGLFNEQFCDNLLILQSKIDSLSDYQDLKDKFDSYTAKNKKLIEYENYGHFILLENDWKNIANEIIVWIDEVLK
jgi:alpha-beta hydrolase superfamily lysophospholipase